MHKKIMVDTIRKYAGHPAALVIAVGIILRLYACYNSFLFNSDGVVYINQARALYYDGLGSVKNCYPYYNILPLFVAAFYKIFGDWVVAAKTVSMVFSIATMVPLYLLLRRFLDTTLASCALLLFAVNPALVALSSDVLRGPIYWFFMTLGLYLFSRLDDGKYKIFLVASCLAFLLAASARIEALLFLIISPGYLLIAGAEKRWTKLLFFLLPLVVAGAAALFSLWLFDYDLHKVLFQRPFLAWVLGTFARYEALQQDLGQLAGQNHVWFNFPYFWRDAVSLLWWLALGVVLNGIVETVFEPFALFFLLGCIGLRKRLKIDRFLGYPVLLAVAAFFMLYAQVINSWFMSERFAMAFLLPAFVVFGFGLEKAVAFLKKKLPLRQSLVYFVICAIIVGVSLPKNLKARRAERKVYQEIGGFIAEQEGGSREILIAGTTKHMTFIHFFANAEYAGSPCFHINQTARLRPAQSLDIEDLRQKGFAYYVWDEANRSPQELEMLRNLPEASVSEKGMWPARNEGKLVLFRIN